jgi:glycosyltransferase involved in cell wall biosynthesis
MSEPSAAVMLKRQAALPISVICLTYNEHENLAAALESVRSFVDEIVVVDSYSTDDTLEIASSYADTVYQHPFENYARQLAWAMQLPLRNDWVLRLDADERWSPEAFAKLAPLLDQKDVAGVSVRMKILFMGRWIRHGDLYPNQFLRVFRKEGSQIENRWMDEHIKIAGRSVRSDIDVLEENYDRQHNLAGWTTKHNSYSTREAVDIVLSKYDAPVDSIARLSGNKTERKRWVKEKIYNRTPLFLRPLMYFVYRYFVKLGFLDGVEGLVFHFLQGLWYRFLVDAKVMQIERRMNSSGKTARQILKEMYGIDAG